MLKKISNKLGKEILQTNIQIQKKKKGEEEPGPLGPPQVLRRQNSSQNKLPWRKQGPKVQTDFIYFQTYTPQRMRQYVIIHSLN